MDNNKSRLIWGMIALIWLTLMISLYYVFHKPITSELAYHFTRILKSLGVALGLISLCGGLGKRILSQTDVFNSTNPLALMAVESGLGIGLLALFVLVSGSTIGINPLWYWGSLLILGLLWRKAVIAWWRPLREIRILWENSTQWAKTLLIGTGLILLFTLTVAMAPPLAWDSLIYHLALPALYQRMGRIVFVSWSFFGGMPQTAEMLYTWALVLAGAEAATLLGWCIGVVSILGLAGYVYGHFGARAGVVAVVSLLSGYTLASSLSWGYVDWLTLLLGLGLLTSLEAWVYTERKPALLVAGALAGTGLATKYTTGVLAIAGIVLIVWEGIRVRRSRPILAQVLLFGAVVILISLPWWIKNALATGNPFYPFFIPSGAMDRFRLSFYSLSPWADWKDAALLPVMATLTGIEGKEGYSASIGPLLLGLGIWALLGKNERASVEKMAISLAAKVAITGLIIWIIAGRISGMLIQSRLYFSLFGLFAVLAGAGFKALEQVQFPGLRVGRVAGALVTLVFGLSVFAIAHDTLKQGAPQWLFGVMSEKDYKTSNLGWYFAAMWAIQDLPEDARVLMLWEPRGYYCLPKCIPDEIIDRWKHDRMSFGDTDAILDEWRTEGFTHVLYHRYAAVNFVKITDHRYSATDWSTLEELLSRLPPPMDIGGVYLLYSLKP